MTDNIDTKPRETTFREDLMAFIRHHLRGWRGLLALGILLAGPALWLGGPWLVAVGGLSLLLSLAPCLVMCGLGLCMMKSCNTKGNSEQDTTPDAAAAPTEDAAAMSAAPEVEQKTDRAMH